MLGEGGVQQTTIKTPWKSGRSFRLLIEDQISASASVTKRPRDLHRKALSHNGCQKK
jgi:hypothetical protein